MKKNLIALAALAAIASTSAFAQSAVSIDGVADVGLQQITYKGGNKITAVGGNGSSTSQLNIRGSEDLGGGLKAEFRVETDWNLVSNNANTGAASKFGTVASDSANSTVGTFGNGELRVGLAGGFGRVDAGTVNLNSLDTFLAGQPYGTAIGGGFRGVYVTDTSASSSVRADQSIKYTSPSFAGFTGTVFYSAKNTDATQANYSTTVGAYDRPGTKEIGLNYKNGPLAVSFSQNEQDYAGVQGGAGAAAAAQAYTTKVRTLGANYAVTTDIKVYGLAQTVGSDNASWDRSFHSVGASYTMGANQFSALYGSGKNNTVAGAGKTTSMFSLGVDHSLSKRTALYARYENIKDDGAFIPAAATVDQAGDTTRTRAAVGLRHTF